MRSYEATSASYKDSCHRIMPSAEFLSFTCIVSEILDGSPSLVSTMSVETQNEGDSIGAIFEKGCIKDINERRPFGVLQMSTLDLEFIHYPIEDLVTKDGG